MKFSSVLRDAWFFFSRNIITILTLCLPWLLLASVCQWFLREQLGNDLNLAYPILLELLFYPLYSAVLILFLAARNSGQPVTSRQLLAQTLRLWPGYLLLSGLTTLLLFLGMLVFVLVYFWLMVKLIFAEFAFVLEGATPWSAIGASFQQTRGHFWTILLCLLFILTPLQLLDWWTQPDHSQAVLWVFQQSLLGILQSFATVAAFRLYLLSRAPAEQ